MAHPNGRGGRARSLIRSSGWGCLPDRRKLTSGVLGFASGRRRLPASAAPPRRRETSAAQHSAIAAAWVFGSTPRGDAQPDSDLDVAILLRPDASDSNELALYDLASALECFSPSGRVDILVLGDQGPVLRHRILSEGKLVHDADRRARIDFEGRTFVEYLDWKPTHDIAMRAALRGLANRFARGIGKP